MTPWIALITTLVALLAPATSDAAPLRTVDTLVGTWSGQWRSDGSGRGSAELVLARVPGRDTVVGQFTFIAGGVARSLRYEGHVDGGSLRFPLVGGGRMVLTPETATRPTHAQRLRGEWVDARGALPASDGVIELDRVP